MNVTLLLLMNDNRHLPLRSPHTVMHMERIGAFHQTRLSFVRTIMRKMMREQWQIECTRFDLDERGYGNCIYTICTPGHQPSQQERYTLVIFSQYLEDSRRSDRVIADAWDIAFALCDGEVSDVELEQLRINVPLQEAGRCGTNVLVLSRANKSLRNFDYFVETLAQGRQPDPAVMAKVGYLYRTTAVYGNGKFGIADYARLQERRAFAYPFSAQMFTVYMLRHFSIQQVNFLAKQRNPTQAVPLDNDLSRYLGVGNATGLGMAPFLINHPKLINQWMSMRETAIACVVYEGEVTPANFERFQRLTSRAIIHISEIYTDDERQHAENRRMHEELRELQDWMAEQRVGLKGSKDALWQTLVSHAAIHWSYETQEMIYSILLELYPEQVNSLEADMGVIEDDDLSPSMPLPTLKSLIESHYDWALAIDFNHPTAKHYFWYRSMEKEEPRLGERRVDSGHEKEVQIAIGWAVRRCYDALCVDLSQYPNDKVIDFLVRQPEHKGIVRRIQCMAQTEYGEIRANLLDKSCLPIHLLRCKLSFFGASKFDPKSALWVRITLFQGAPLISEIGQLFADDWFLPTMPRIDDM